MFPLLEDPNTELTQNKKQKQRETRDLEEHGIISK